MTNIPIFLASDDNYAPFLCTTIYSILENTNSVINFYVLDNGISGKSKRLIEKSLKKFKNHSIEYLDISNIGLDRFPNLRHYSVNAFSRYFIPELKPQLVKVLYLDVDIIVKGDIKELFNQDLEGKSLGVTSENFYELNGIYVKKNLKPEFKDTKNYFNTGILVMDLEKIHKNNLMQVCIDKTIEFGDKLSTADQDVLNIVFEDDVKFIDQKFDYMPDLFNFYNKFYGWKKANELKNQASILHYTSGKPWFNKSVESELFWQVASKTKFYCHLQKKLKKFQDDEILKRENYFKNNFKLKPAERIFSIKKFYYENLKIRVVTILGIKIKSKWMNY